MRALIIVDMQVGCFAGEPPRRDADGTVERINALAAGIRHHNHLWEGLLLPRRRKVRLVSTAELVQAFSRP
jgi:hypothetical protein